MSRTVFLDTNIFLHYQPFDQIDWVKILGTDSVTIIIPPVTTRELNKHKDLQSRPHIKKRAGEMIKRLYRLFESGPDATIKEKVNIHFEDRDPAIDYAAYQLNQDIQDDNLIASIIMHRNETPKDQITLVTSDLGLLLLAKAGRQGIDTIRMPDALRIAEKPDPTKNRVKQLEQEIRELKSRVPKLSLAFEDGAQHVTFALPKPIKSVPSDIKEKLTKLKQRYPKRGESTLPSKSKQTEHRSGLAELRAIVAAFEQSSQKEIDRYNSEVDRYIPAYAKYLENKVGFDNSRRRTIRLGIVLTNDGTAPAEDIDIYMHFPDGFRLIDEHDLSNPPRAPQPPVKPRTQMQMMASPLNVDHLIQAPILGAFNNSELMGPPSNVSGPDIKRTNSYDVHIHVQKAKHNLPVPLDPLYIVFDSYKSAGPFQIDCRILAANIPHEVAGNLHVIIKKEENAE